MGCAPSSQEVKEEKPANRLDIKLPCDPVVLPYVKQYEKRNDGTLLINPPRRHRTVPKLSTIEESNIIRRRRTMKKSVSLPEMNDDKRSLTLEETGISSLLH